MEDHYQHIAELIRQGKKIEAIKRLREATGIGLKQAKDEVERLSRELTEEVQHEAGADLEQALQERVKTLVEQGKKIEAIKLLREQTGLGLKEAKERVEAMTGTGGGCLGSMLLLVATGLLLALMLH